MIRNPSPDGKACIYVGEKPTHNEKDFVAAPVKKGMCGGVNTVAVGV